MAKLRAVSQEKVKNMDMCFYASEDTPIFLIISNTLGQFDPVHFWSLIIPQLLNHLTYTNSEVYFKHCFNNL